MLEKVALKHSSKSTKYELEGSYDDLVHEHFCFLKTAKLLRKCNKVLDIYKKQEIYKKYNHETIQFVIVSVIA